MQKNDLCKRQSVLFTGLTAEAHGEIWIREHPDSHKSLVLKPREDQAFFAERGNQWIMGIINWHN